MPARVATLLRLLRLALPVLVGGTTVWAIARACHDVPPPRRFDYVDGTAVRVRQVLPSGELEIGDGLVVRLIGVEIPGDAEATVDWLHERVLDRYVTLRFDRERLDEDERILAYVEVDSENLNLAVVEAGWARLDHRAAFSASIKRIMQKAEDAARAAERGLWSNGPAT